MKARTLSEPRVLLDARWLGRGGPGRATELLLRGLGDRPPPGRWIVWGPETVAPFLWDGSEHHLVTHSPARLWGQGAVRLPAHDRALYLHQIRPLAGKHAVTLIHDTIPLRYASNAGDRWLKRVYLRSVARRSVAIITVSEFSRHCIERDLRVDRRRISVVRYPVDRALAERVRRLRADLEPRARIVWVGRYARHKNLERLIEAFSKTAFADSGGELVLAGIEDASKARVESAAHGSRATITVLGTIAQDKLDRLYATSRALVMPSLEEGFGLPAWEAMACGLPVALADAGSLPEIGTDVAHFFPPTSISAMARAIDEAVEAKPGAAPAAALGSAPSVEEFAARVARIVVEAP